MKSILIVLSILFTHELLAFKSNPIVQEDTVVGSNPITNELAGSAYRKRATCYFLIINKDTSEFKPVFVESKENGSVGLLLDLPYHEKVLDHEQRLNELKYILSVASKEYDFEKWDNISLGRLVLSGNLTVNITTDFLNDFGKDFIIRTKDYEDISEFLLSSKLSNDFNKLLEPYQLVMTQVQIEKAFFTTRQELIAYSNIDSVELPEKILDCITWIIIGKSP